MKDERLRELLTAARIALPDGADAAVDGADPVLPARYAIAETAATSIVASASAAAALHEARGGARQSVATSVRAAAAAILSFAHQRIDGRATPRTNEANPTVALYECGDGRWIHLHGGFPNLKAGTLRLLACDDDAASIAAAVKQWRAQELEDALAAAGMCGAMVRTADEWVAHPQARSIADLPVVEIERIGDAAPIERERGTRPLEGIRVLDLTRVLAGPACGRELAAHGADVLLVSSPSLPSIEPFVMDTSHGKRSAYVDLARDDGAATLRELAATADVFIEGYRSGSLARRGFGPEQLAAMRPGIVYVSINCYGHHGPWRERPGWEQLAQTVSGIAAAQGAPGPPRLLPAAACDYTTGYLAAYGAMTALSRQMREGGSWHVRASLCQTAMWIERTGAVLDPAAATGIGDVSNLTVATETPWGRLVHLRPAAAMSATMPRWALPSSPLGTHEAEWPV